MSRYVIHGTQLNGRDQWTFEADDYKIKDGLIVASGSFERKRHYTVLHVPLSSIIYIEEPPVVVARRPRRLRRHHDLGDSPVPAEIASPSEVAASLPIPMETKRRPGRPRKNHALPQPKAKVSP